MRTELYAGSPVELAPEWEDVHRADPTATPFVAPGWGLAWMRHLGRETEPWFVTVRDQDRLVGLAPLALERRRGRRIVRLVGKEPGDYWDVLALPDYRRAVVAAVASELSRRGRQWDVFHLSGQPGDYASEAISRDRSLRVLPRASIPCPGIALPDDFDDYLRMLPGSRRANVRKHIRRLDEGKVGLRMVTDPDELEIAVRRWHELHLKRWEGLAEPINPMHPTSAFRDFMLDAMRALVPRELATVWEFVADGEVVGSYLNLIDDDAFYWYLGGFEPRCAALGIGKLSIAQGIRWSIETGRSYFDLTRGVESFKYYFGASDRECPSVVVGNERLRSRAAFATDELGHRARAAARDVRARLPDRGTAKPEAGAPPERRSEPAGAAPSSYRERVSVPR